MNLSLTLFPELLASGIRSSATWVRRGGLKNLFFHGLSSVDDGGKSFTCKNKNKLTEINDIKTRYHMFSLK